jgi:hypothetical protein
MFAIIFTCSCSGTPQKSEDDEGIPFEYVYRGFTPITDNSEGVLTYNYKIFCLKITPSRK